MELQYRLKRHDPRITRPELSDHDFFLEALELGHPGLEGVKAAAEAGDFGVARREYLAFFRANSSRGHAFGVAEAPRLATFVKERYPGKNVERAVREADRLLAGDLPLTEGKRWQFTPGQWDWNRDFYDSTQHQLFLARFFYLKNLSRAYLFTGQGRYARGIAEMLTHFIADCPVPRDGTFRNEHCTWETLDVALRSGSWIEPLVSCFDAPEFGDDAKMAIIKSLREHGRYLRAYPAHGGNHLTMEMRALVNLAVLFPEFRASADWLKFGVAGAVRSVEKDVLPDGVQNEGSPNYHVVVVQNLVDLASTLRRAGVPDLPAEVSTLPERMFEATMHLMSPLGGLPNLGDTTHDSSGSIRDLLARGAMLYGRADFKAVGTKPLPGGYVWQHGVEAVERFDRLPAEAPREKSACYPVSGYFTARSSWEPDAGFLALRGGYASGGHVHADLLSPVIFAHGRNLLVDAGKGIYEWVPSRKYILSTRAHNTVVVDGQDQMVRSQHWGRFESWPAHVWDFRRGPGWDFFFGSHYGYTRLDDPVVHTRKVLCVHGRYWLFVDLLHAREHHRHDLYFHLPAGEVAADAAVRRVRTLTTDAPNLLVVSHDNGGDAVSGQVERGWISVKGESAPGPVVRFTQEVVGPATFVTLLVASGRGEAAPEVKMETLGNAVAEDETALTITLAGRTDRVGINHRSVDVTRFLDHTGNTFSPSEAPARQPSTVNTVPWTFAGQERREDVMFEAGA